MGKASKWLRNFFTGKKTKEKAGDSNPDWPTENRISSVPFAASKEKRWSFRRSVGATKEFNFTEPSLSEPFLGFFGSEIDQKRHSMAAAENDGTTRAIEEASAIKIQSIFRSYLARKALNALKGLVKMQALVRGHLVRKQANATLRCMQALVKAQVRARAERIRMVEDSQSTPLRQQNYRKSPHHPFKMDCNEEEYIKIVEMDICGRNYSLGETERTAPSALTENFEEFSFAAAQNSPQLSAMSVPTNASFEYPFYPNYMANTESSRAKLRSQSAPKQRFEAYERQTSKRRQSGEGRNIPRGVRMQRSSSHAGLEASNYEYPLSIKLDRSNMSFVESESGSTSTVLTNKNCWRSLAGFENHGNDY